MISRTIRGFALNVVAGVGLLGVTLMSASSANAQEEPETTISTDGFIESKEGGFKFPDGSIQETATLVGPQGPQVTAFVTSTTYDGNLGGVAGADEKCQARADAANLPGSWIAWLSDSRNPAPARLAEAGATGPYRVSNLTYVAATLTDLSITPIAKLYRPINITEFGTKITGQSTLQVWTGTILSDITTELLGDFCEDWSNSGSVPGAIAGDASRTDQGWTEGCNTGDPFCAVPGNNSCSTAARLYCFAVTGN